MTALEPTSPALELAAALRRRELSAVELLDACLAAVDERNPQLNAVIWRNDEDARAAAAEADRRLAAGEHAPFLGVPIPIKDLTPVAGWPVTYGSDGAPEGPSAESELVVDALARAGFVLCGRTNTPAFGVITVAENSRYGVSRNPWDSNRSPGGSSGGAAAAVAGGLFPIAHANDGGGSIRIPASYCGLVGFKPSRGRVPRLAQSWLGAVVEGVVSHTVADSAAVLDAISGVDHNAWYNAPAPTRPFADEVGRGAGGMGSLRIGLMASAPLGIPTDESCMAGARATAAALEELGHLVEEVEVPTISEEMVPPFIALTQGGFADYDGVDWSKTEPHIQHQRKLAGETGAYDYALAGRALELLSRREVARWGRDFDVLLTPTSAILPPVAGSILEATHAAPEAPNMEVVASVSFTAFGNVSGLPSVSLPLHWSEEGLPVGVMLTAGPWEDGALYALAAQLEQARPWAARRPSLLARAA
jgi:amidase